MEQSGVRRGLLLEYFDSTIAYPTPDFSSYQRRKHDEKPGSYLFSEYRHGQACFGDGEPGSFGQLFNLDGSKGTEEYSTKSVYETAI